MIGLIIGQPLWSRSNIINLENGKIRHPFYEKEGIRWSARPLLALFFKTRIQALEKSDNDYSEFDAQALTKGFPWFVWNEEGEIKLDDQKLNKMLHVQAWLI